MSPLIQACIVVVTLSAVAIAIVVIRAAMRLDQLSRDMMRATEQTAIAMQQSMADVQSVTRRIDAMVSALGQTVPAIHQVVHEFEHVGERASRLSNTVLEEIEAPIRTAVAVARGVRVGATSLMQALARHTHSTSNLNGGRS